MTLRSALLAATVLALPIAANAQPINGVYVGAGVGINYLPQENVQITGGPSGNLKSNNVGPAFVLSLGYGFGNGLRAEVEGDYRSNRFTGTSGFGGSTGGGFEQKYGVMANVLYDFNVSPMVMPYLGAGVGYQAVDEQGARIGGGVAKNDIKGSFAYQAIAGLAFPIASAPGLALTAEYRFLGLAGERSYSSTFVDGGSAKSTDNYNHSLLVGVRYAFGAPAMMAATAATSAQAPAAAMARSYLVFFDWDKATLTERARGIIKDAATNSTKVSYTKIDLNGNADTSGTPAYNKGLSMRRAEAVAAELVKDGVPKNAIAITASGDTKLLVPTGPGVREPQNRRVEINIR